MKIKLARLTDFIPRFRVFWNTKFHTCEFQNSILYILWSILYGILYLLDSSYRQTWVFCKFSQIYLIKISNFLTKQSWETASNVVLKRYKDDVDTGNRFQAVTCTMDSGLKGTVQRVGSGRFMMNRSSNSWRSWATMDRPLSSLKTVQFHSFTESNYCFWIQDRPLSQPSTFADCRPQVFWTVQFWWPFSISSSNRPV